MGPRAWDAVMLALCAAWLLALAVIATGPSGGVVGFLHDPATAAWAQAFGAIGAIAGSAWIAGRQSREAIAREETSRRHAEAVRRKASADDRAVAEMLASYTVSSMKIIRDKMAESEFVEVYRKIPGAELPGEAEHREMQRFPLELLRDEVASRYFLSLREQHRCYMDTLKLICRPGLNPDQTKECFKLLDQYIGTAESFEQHLKERLATLKS